MTVNNIRKARRQHSRAWGTEQYTYDVRALAQENQRQAKEEYSRLTGVPTSQQDDNWRREMDATVGQLWSANVAEENAQDNYEAAYDAAEQAMNALIKAENATEKKGALS